MMTASTERLAAALGDRYRIEGELGQGSMATVYLASDLKHDRKVALKVLKPELVAILGAERFIQEIKTIAPLQHPNIVPLFDSGSADGLLYYVMPFIKGETLRRKLTQETQCGIDEAVRITVEVAAGLEHAHQHGVIHRDIKPENILLQDGRAMVSDFGIALAVSAAGGDRMTSSGITLGTPPYMSPEQATAEKGLTARSDVYSLASVLYEMLTGSPPHVGASSQQVLMKIVMDPARPVTELRKSVPPNVATATARALEKVPADRYPSAAAFAAALGNASLALDGASSATRPSGRIRPAGRRWVRWAVAVGQGAIGFAVAMALLRRDGAAPAVVRFYPNLPSTHRVLLRDQEDAPFAVSPDGTRIVYAAIDSGVAGTSLYIRRLDQIGSDRLPGTEDAVGPFFSPDGLWVGFATAADGKLKKVPVGGGPAIILADDVADNFGGGSWGDDGFVVYTSTDLVLSRVRGTGGLPTKLVDPNGADHGKMFWPFVLPGGKAVLFERCLTAVASSRGSSNRDCPRKDLAVLDVATGSTEVVVPGATRGWYLGTGHLIYATENGALSAVPFDPGRRRVQGSAVPVLDSIRTGVAHGSRLAISTLSGTMIYLAGTSDVWAQLVEVDRSGRETVILSRDDRYQHPRWSPDGGRIAMDLKGETGSQIWIYDVASETLSQLTVEGSNVRPTWSPDGTRVAYFSTLAGVSTLWWMMADKSGQPERVVPGEPATGSVGTAFWTRDGSSIVVHGIADTSRGDFDIFAVSTGDDRTREPVAATPAQEETGSVSPDGKWLAYGSDEGGRWQVYVRPFRGPGGRTLISTGTAESPLWASNTEVVYAVGSQSLTAATLEFSPTVRVVERTRLFGIESYLPGRSSPQFDISRDGQRFLALRDTKSAQRRVEPIVVLNWFEEVKRLMAEQGRR